MIPKTLSENINESVFSRSEKIISNIAKHNIGQNVICRRSQYNKLQFLFNHFSLCLLEVHIDLILLMNLHISLKF